MKAIMSKVEHVLSKIPCSVFVVLWAMSLFDPSFWWCLIIDTLACLYLVWGLDRVVDDELASIFLFILFAVVVWSPYVIVWVLPH